jgi:hypothetical protein
MNPIRLPAAAAILPQLSDAKAAEIRQARHGATITLSGTKTFCQVLAPPPPGAGHAVIVEPFVVDVSALARVAEAVGLAGGTPRDGRPLTMIRISPEVVGVVGPAGSPQTIPVSKLPPGAETVIDAVQGEAASGMTRAVAVVETDYLRRLGEACIASGITAVEITFAPRWNAILAEARLADGCEITFGSIGINGERTVAREAEAKPEAPATASPVKSGSLVFTVAGPKPRAKRAARPAKPERLSFEDDLPF